MRFCTVAILTLSTAPHALAAKPSALSRADRKMIRQVLRVRPSATKCLKLKLDYDKKGRAAAKIRALATTVRSPLGVAIQLKMVQAIRPAQVDMLPRMFNCDKRKEFGRKYRFLVRPPAKSATRQKAAKGRRGVRRGTIWVLGRYWNRKSKERFVERYGDLLRKLHAGFGQFYFAGWRNRRLLTL